MGGMHCLKPACIRTSVTQSLAKLRIETLDLLYLHNAAEVQLLPLGREAFMQVRVQLSLVPLVTLAETYQGGNALLPLRVVLPL